VTIDGAEVSGSVTVAGVPADPRLDLSIEVERVDFARLLRTSGVGPAPSVASRVGGTALDADLGSASLSAHVAGRLTDPDSFTVSQRLDFTPPRRPLPALVKLRDDFVHEVVLASGERRGILVSPASPDFIALHDVPPLFVRTLLLAEDSAFFGHRGIDLSEMPHAILRNWTRGGAARGASTITQQLAKNLFLSREKRLGRKLQELSLALLLESTLSKERTLEIYLNVIEWGPDLYGLRPAAARYFSRRPDELSPAQMAFLVSLIPGPTKYQRSLASGTPSPAFRSLVHDLLAKLRSVDAITEEQYQAALVEELIVDAVPRPQPVLRTRLSTP
jgi:membrane peptidoglycan carboxypeptidase